MAGVLVVTDSSACVPVDLVASLAIRVLPISVHLPDGDLDEIRGQLDQGWVLPESVEVEELAGANHPFVTEYLEAIEAPSYDAAVIITPAIEFATMYRNAVLASELATRPVVVIDARTAAAGQALAVLAGAELASRGAPLADVVRAIEDASRRVELVATLETLEPIRRSGPLPGIVLTQEVREGTRSVFRMRDGVVEPLADAAGPGAALEVIRHAFDAHRVGGIERSTVFHAGASELADELAALLGGVDFISGFSIAMQVHTGRGVVGAAWLPRQVA